MSARGFVRLAAASAVLGGLLWAVGDGLLTWGVEETEAFADTALQTNFQVAMGLMAVGVFATAIGAIGMHLHQPRRTGLLGATALLVLLAGLWWVGGVLFSNIFLSPAMAEADPEALAALDESTRLGIMWMVGFMGLLAGFVLFGSVQAWYANLNRYAALAVVLAAVLAFTELVIPFDSFLLGGAIAYLGVDLWRRVDGAGLETGREHRGPRAVGVVGRAR